LLVELVRFAQFERGDTAKAQADFEAAPPAIKKFVTDKIPVSEILTSPETKTVYK